MAHYSGPIKPMTSASIAKATHCHHCGKRLNADEIRRGAWWCLPCADPDGYSLRLRVARAKQLEATRQEIPLMGSEQLPLL